MGGIMDRYCRKNHSDHWDYVDDKNYWCPICRAMRPSKGHSASQKP